MKTLVQVNRDYAYHCYQKEMKAMERDKGSIIKDTIYYAVLVIVVLGALIWSGGDDSAKRFGPFSYHTVLTESMNSVYPKGSLVTAWAVKPNETYNVGLENGDDIVFIMPNGRVVVHRIIEVVDENDDSGRRVFLTQGVDNERPDFFVTDEGNIIGRVTWHVPYVGAILALISENILYVSAGIAVLFLLFTLIGFIFFGKEKEAASKKKDESEPEENGEANPEAENAPQDTVMEV